jgi:hypothetical protein
MTGMIQVFARPSMIGGRLMLLLLLLLQLLLLLLLQLLLLLRAAAAAFGGWSCYARCVFFCPGQWVLLFSQICSLS